MDVNKRLFKQLLATILRKHRTTMIDLEHFDRTRTVGLDKKIPVEEYGIKWLGGIIMLRRYTNDNNVEINANFGGYFDSLEINYYDIDSNDFITSNKQLIKELIQGVDQAYQNRNEV